MSEYINIPAIIIANLMGIMLMAVLGAGNRWRLIERNAENRILVAMIAVTFLACIADPIAFIADGRSGFSNHLIVYGANFAVYILILLMGILWITLTALHVVGSVSKNQKTFLGIILSTAILMLFGNFSYPLLFSVSENNIYHREMMYGLYSVMVYMLVVGGIIVCFKARLRGGVLKFFPIWQFVVPVSIGTAIQCIFYGISVIFPFIAVSICGVVVSLQNERMFRDKLTGLYNRFYLDILKDSIEKKKRNGNITAIMLDLNDFKHINDVYGHAEGDKALIIFADICNRATGNLGTVIRYAGDEFVILLNTQNRILIEDCIWEIKRTCEKINRSNAHPYSLSAAAGYSQLNLKEKSIEELLHEVDIKMYEEKQLYYMEHSEKDRRNRNAKNQSGPETNANKE